jgi:hypothetical protein
MSTSSSAATMDSLLTGLHRGMMLADLDFTIAYSNPSANELLLDAETQLARRYPGFDARSLVGRKLNDLLPLPEVRCQELRDVSRLPLVIRIVLDDRALGLRVAGTLDSAGHHCGFVLEWTVEKVERAMPQPATARTVARIQDGVRAVQETAGAIRDVMDRVQPTRPVGAGGASKELRAALTAFLLHQSVQA